MSVDAITAAFYKAAFGAIPWGEALGAARLILRSSCTLQLTGIDAAGGMSFSFEADEIHPPPSLNG